jgi:hypothetical protein
MKVEIKDLELNKELDTKAKVATRGGLGALTVETTSALASSNLARSTCATHSICDIDGTCDVDSTQFFDLAPV